VTIRLTKDMFHGCFLSKKKGLDCLSFEEDGACTMWREASETNGILNHHLLVETYEDTGNAPCRISFQSCAQHKSHCALGRLLEASSNVRRASSLSKRFDLQ
jgi:hypothetical protein